MLDETYGESMFGCVPVDVILAVGEWPLNPARIGRGVVFQRGSVRLSPARGHLSVIIAAEHKAGPVRNAMRFRMLFWWRDRRRIMLPAALVVREIEASGHDGRSR